MLKYTLCVLALVMPVAANAATIVTYYGDDDGFGLGITSGSHPDPTVSNAGPGDAPFTDVPLINDFFPDFPPFLPTGSFDPYPFPLPGPIVSATLTLRLASFEKTGPNVPNRIQFSGLLLDVGAILSDVVTKANGADHRIDTITYILPTSIYGVLDTFFPVTPGVVGLRGTRLSDATGFGAFQVDFLKLTIETEDPVAPVPLPATLPALLGALGALGWVARRQSRA